MTTPNDVLAGRLLDAIDKHDEANIHGWGVALRAALAHAAPAGLDVETQHEPGDAHRYGPLVCEVCGVRGQVRVAIVPERAEPEYPDE